MLLVTLTSDFGNKDHYVAALKAGILNTNPNIKIVDISHDIEPFNISHGAYVLRSVFREFPKGSVHVVALDTYTPKWGAIAMKLEEHYFVAPDNGILSLLSEQTPKPVININQLNPTRSIFPAKNLYANIAANIASGKDLHELGPPQENWTQLLNRKIKTTKALISGHVIRIDHYGNLITNIPKSEFDTISLLNKNNGFQITLGRERINTIHSTYHSVDPGECFCIFNDNGLLEIGINSGNASNLLGIQFDSPITLNFNQ
ncbi:MAG: SAM-dependent chlorinase/fluorinase [Cyclobacteriaceae bacterium]